MPIYEYQCQACGHRLEKLQKISDDPLRDCPSCDKPELSKLVSAAGFRLKGGGWYETDFKKGAKKNVAESSGSGASSDAGSSDSKPDKKTESKPDTKSSESKSSSKPAAAS